jgi:uncharacterized protein (TIGR02145 family)
VKKDPVASLALLRNHCYNVVIQDVKDHGYPQKEGAYNNLPSNIVVEITEWNDGGMNDVIFNGQHYLAVDKSHVTLYREGSAKTIEALTDYGSWIIEIPTAAGNDWFEVAETSYTGGETKQPISVTMKVGSDLSADDPDRTGHFYIVAGNLKKRIDVTQHNSPELLLSIVDPTTSNPISELHFDATLTNINSVDPPASRQIRVEWSPSSSAPLIVTPIRNNISYTATFTNFATVNSVPGTGSPHTFTVQPTAITAEDIAPTDPLPYTRTTNLLFHMTLEDGQHKNLPFTITQEFNGVVPSVAPVYLMDGVTQHSFSVRSVFPFKIAVKSDPNHVLTLQTSEEDNPVSDPEGTPVYFTLIDDRTAQIVLATDVILTISNLDDTYQKDVTIRCVFDIQPNSNSYIVNPGGTAILIPVARCNESDLGAQLGASEAFTAMLVWTDNSNGVSASSNIQDYKTVLAGNRGYLYVKTGSASGNAVIAIMKSGTILWSWHIWSPADSPALSGSRGFMDRNLGATTNTPGVLTTLGLVYQWGRKDPFQTSSENVFSGNTVANGGDDPALPMYDANGAAVQETRPEAPSTPAHPGNIGITVQNPLAFYRSSKSWYDNSGTVLDESLWGQGGVKTVYDPCPPGWRVPISHTLWSGMNATTFPWDETVTGWTSTDVGGFYPASGGRNGESGKLLATGEQVFQWAASTNSTTAYHLLVRSTKKFANPSESITSFAFSVRCIAE